MRSLLTLLTAIFTPILVIAQTSEVQVDSFSSYPWTAWLLAGMGLMTVLMAIFALARAVESLSQRVREKSHE